MSVLHKYLNPPANLSPSLEVVARIAKATSTTIDWLATGVGETPTVDSDLLKVPIYGVSFAAGNGSLFNGANRVGEMPFDRAYLRSMGFTSTEGLGIVTASGDSMEPLISDDAPVLICHKDTRLREGIFAFRLGDTLRIKRLRHHGLNGVEAISVNPLYEPEVIEGELLNHFQILGRAHWSGTLL